MRSKTTLLKIHNLEVSFLQNGSSFKALHGINMELLKGEICVITGPTGSGKSLTAHSILRLLDTPLASQTGSITFKDWEISTLSESEMNSLRGSQISIMPQDPLAGFNPVIRIGKQIQEALLLDNPTSKQLTFNKTLALIEEVGLSNPLKYYNAWPANVSGGELQRLMFAMSIAREPELLILDEPTSSLDYYSREIILQLIKKKVAEDGLTILLITHDLQNVIHIADRIYILNHGKITDHGSISYLKHHARSPLTKLLFNAIPPADILLKRLPTTLDEKPIIRPEVKSKSQSPVLQVHNLYTSYFSIPEEDYIIKDLSFELFPGECLGVLGPSGSGKSTLALALTGLAEKVRGEVILNGYNILRLNGKALRLHRKDIQMIWQNPLSALNPHYTVRETLEEAISLCPKEKDAYTLSELLKMVQMSPSFLDRYPNQLSGGQQQRICIARALGLRPSVLICDEPVSSLDTLTQAHILNLLKTLQENLELSLVFISHNINVIHFMADVILKLEPLKSDFSIEYNHRHRAPNK